MIELNNIEDFIFEYIDNLDNLKPNIIYIGTGTCYYSTNDKHWNYEDNQQFPPFLHDFKSINIDAQILVVLIDPNFTYDVPPYIVSSSDKFYSCSWDKSKEHINLFHSSLGIDVITIADSVVWGNNLQEDNHTFDFENFMVKLCNKISEFDHNTILFYHEFTGANVMMLEQIIKNKSTNYNPNKICIDITRGSNMSCYFNLSNPEFYPIMLFDENDELQYIDPYTLPNDTKIQIVKQYKRFTDGFEDQDSNCDYSPSKPNYLLLTDLNIVLCFQIIKSDKIIFNLISDGLIPMIRYLYICDDELNINNKMWGINHITNLKYYISDVSNQIECIKEDLNLIELINSNISKNPDYKSTIRHLKEIIIDKLFDIIKNVLKNILVKYQIDEMMINDLIEKISKLSNKYEMLTIYNNFILSLNI